VSWGSADRPEQRLKQGFELAASDCPEKESTPSGTVVDGSQMPIDSEEELSGGGEKKARHPQPGPASASPQLRRR